MAEAKELPQLDWAEHHRFERDIALFELGVLDIDKLISMTETQAAGYLGSLETQEGISVELHADMRRLSEGYYEER